MKTSRNVKYSKLHPADGLHPSYVWDLHLLKHSHFFTLYFLRIKMLKVQVHAFQSLHVSRLTHKDLKTRQLLEPIRNWVWKFLEGFVTGRLASHPDKWGRKQSCSYHTWLKHCWWPQSKSIRAVGMTEHQPLYITNAWVCLELAVTVVVQKGQLIISLCCLSALQNWSWGQTETSELPVWAFLPGSCAPLPEVQMLFNMRHRSSPSNPPPNWHIWEGEGRVRWGSFSLWSLARDGIKLTGLGYLAWAASRCV